MERLFEHLRELIRGATSRVGPQYFQLPVADADAVYRERVYCYELYHQLRCLWDGFPLSLGGEVDKRGNPHFENGPYARAKPDFLVHRPGDMEENLASVEVKSAIVDLADLRADLRKLVWFCQNARYFRGVFLIYGDAGEPEALTGKIRQAGASDPGVDFAVIEFLYHRYVGEQATTVHP
jgi:hypothetical protein